MKDFSIFIANGSVKKQRPDINLSESLARDCMERFEDAKTIFEYWKKAKIHL